jgi:uncharacterized membrane protein YphA (DoxX/SURF4 family)
MFEYVHSPEPRAPFGDWLLRGGIAFVFVTAGIDKYSPDWVRLFQEIGLGQWFRHFTGVVEILGGILVLIPWTVTAGLVLLGCTMASAALIMIFVVGRPADSIFSGALFIALSLFWWNRRNR